MKISVSLTASDVEFIDEYATGHGVESRSAVVQRAVSQLRANELGDDYAAAWAEWDSSEADLWEVAVADGLTDDAV